MQSGPFRGVVHFIMSQMLLVTDRCGQALFTEPAALLLLIYTRLWPGNPNKGELPYKRRLMHVTATLKYIIWH